MRYWKQGHNTVLADVPTFLKLNEVCALNPVRQFLSHLNIIIVCHSAFLLTSSFQSALARCKNIMFNKHPLCSIFNRSVSLLVAILDSSLPSVSAIFFSSSSLVFVSFKFNFSTPTPVNKPASWLLERSSYLSEFRCYLLLLVTTALQRVASCVASFIVRHRRETTYGDITDVRRLDRT